MIGQRTDHLFLLYHSPTLYSMSTLMRILIMLVVWFLMSLLVLKSCIEPTCCAPDRVEEEAVTPVAPPVAPVSEQYRLATNFGDGTVSERELWPDYRAKLLTDYQANPDQFLDIYGNYYAGETAPDGFENMGLYRADQIKQMLIPDIPAESIRLFANRLDGTAPAATAAWEAGRFNWQNKETKQPDTQVIQLASDEIIIRFPFDSDQKDPAKAVDDYLQKLAQRLGQTNETVVITGHTDSVDTEAYNKSLGQRRADFVKQILVGHGADASRITTRSDGETNPTDTNKTAAGRHNNRRAVVKLTPQ